MDEPSTLSHLCADDDAIRTQCVAGLRKGDDITLEDVKDHASEGDLIPFLYKVTDEQFDMGYCKSSPEFCQWYLTKIKDLCKEGEAMSGASGIENRGICLLISYTAEIIQQGEDIRLERTR